jgi:thioredoxin reductase (NADPH)
VSLLDVLIVGAGPSGLATAIAAGKLGMDYLVLEKGTLVDAIYRFPTNMIFFTTPELLEIGGIPLTTPYEKPTRLEALQYYRKVVDAYQLRIAMHEEVLTIEREDSGSAHGSLDEGLPFVVESRSNRGARRARRARAVVLAMGYYGRPNRLDVPGEDLPHVSHYYDEAHPYYRQRVAIVGGKNSACEAALELYRSGAHVTLVHRRPTLADSVKYWVRPDIENRIKGGAITAYFNTRVVEIRPAEVMLAPAASGEPSLAPPSLPADAVLLLTGYHADIDFMRRVGVEVDEETWTPHHDPDTFETNVRNLFVIGGQLAGKRTGSIFIENGRFHGEQVAKVLGERFATREVRR